ncbi:MAG: conserved phage C-terminal domain-containing protein [Opitutales bacterium]|nr:conserved phage C-terminal domain-containing protein [Opitutales bacterium]
MTENTKSINQQSPYVSNRGALVQYVYYIPEWDALYETRDSRRTKRRTWFTLPVKPPRAFYQLAYKSGVDDALSAIGLWHCLLMFINEKEGEREGFITSDRTRNGKPFELSQIAEQLGFEDAGIQEAMDRLVHFGLVKYEPLSEISKQAEKILIEENRREQTRGEKEVEETDVSPPSLNFSSNEKQTAQTVLTHLNECTSSNFPSTDNQLLPIVERLRGTATQEDCILVVDSKVGEWIDDTTMRANLRPQTLFSAANFENYLAQAPGIIAANKQKKPAESEDRKLHFL